MEIGPDDSFTGKPLVIQCVDDMHVECRRMELEHNECYKMFSLEDLATIKKTKKCVKKQLEAQRVARAAGNRTVSSKVLKSALYELERQKKYVKRYKGAKQMSPLWKNLADEHTAIMSIGIQCSIIVDTITGMRHLWHALGAKFRVDTLEGAGNAMKWILKQISALEQSPVHCQPSREARMPKTSLYLKDVRALKQEWQAQYWALGGPGAPGIQSPPNLELILPPELRKS